MTAGLEDVPPIMITAWSGDYVRQGVIAEPDSVNVTFRHNRPGDASFVLASDNPRIPALTAPGARAVVGYRFDLAEPPIVLSGAVTEVKGSGPVDDASREFMITDDFAAIFNELLGWPNPTGTIGQQGDESAYYKSTGPAETVIKDIVRKNVTRAGVNLTIPTTLGRGTAMTTTIRMHPLYDRLWPAFDTSGLGVRIVQVGDDRQLLIYVPETFGRVLTADSETIVSGAYQVTPPTVTRVVVMAGGEGTARAMRYFIDDDREDEWHAIREGVVDARDVALDDPDLETECAARAAEALADGAPKSGLTVELTETESFRFGSTFNVGDRVSIRLAGAPVLTDHVREVAVSWSPGEGTQVTPLVGDWEETQNAKIKKVIAGTARAVRDMQRSL